MFYRINDCVAEIVKRAFCQERNPKNVKRKSMMFNVKEHDIVSGGSGPSGNWRA